LLLFDVLTFCPTDGQPRFGHVGRHWSAATWAARDYYFVSVKTSTRGQIRLEWGVTNSSKSITFRTEAMRRPFFGLKYMVVADTLRGPIGGAIDAEWHQQFQKQRVNVEHHYNESARRVAAAVCPVND
jgi:hypothetical protein